MDKESRNIQNILNYNRIEGAIRYIRTHFRDQPTLEAIASSVHLSPHHFQRIFTEWAGTSPKKFLKYVTADYTKEILRENRQLSLFEAAGKAGLSGTGRLHDLFVSIDGMTPAEFRDGGKNLGINYSFNSTRFGNVLVASTGRGICHLSFTQNESSSLKKLKACFPKAAYSQQTDICQERALTIFRRSDSSLDTLKLHLRGTDFQIKVWSALLNIPSGILTTYGDIAKQAGNPGASRAVGSAVGKNPVAYIIPCHRVIRSSGDISGYRWGSDRKRVMIGWEAAQADQN
ncbi:methylated-DNA--[protein]-cysteine S-methyltransferase [Rhodohalobacter sp. SW132]|uniref:methylated-DNA--[protein]-cysteine S-methyltransferase n=1 Tax=Rhodohalobacter sp. SW132 TaxID=2293433 RepID=UPI000E270CF1|nr:methylated-DNA--[protein]-cysteine S-methyltransferase [Rhodohalobacter sp. SW132]REL39015.1 methylated-DNA--[protein]-cysteine S-methyltransferase [Rhodohalobacter sp. SW132]